MSKSKLATFKQDRGLLPLTQDQLSNKQQRVYNYSHLHVSPTTYGTTVKQMEKTVLSKTSKLAKQTGVRIIDHSKWGS
jgi:hypothetical protein